MTPPLEHDYIGLSEACVASSTTMEASKRLSEEGGGCLLGSLKETELRLGLPGSKSPERKGKGLLTLDLLPISGSFAATGAKRGFSDVIDGSGRWDFSRGNGSEHGEVGKGSGGRPGNALKDGGLVAKAAVAVAATEKKGQASIGRSDRAMAPSSKAQVVGWPPIRSYRKNTMATNPSKNNDDVDEKQGSGCLYVKVSMDGAPYLRKVDLKMYCNYKELSVALEKMFSCFTIGQCGAHGLPSKDGLNDSRLTDLLHGSEYVLTYEDKDGDWMLVGDVPLDMFTETCKRLRIMKGSEAIGLAPRAMEKCRSRN